MILREGFTIIKSSFKYLLYLVVIVFYWLATDVTADKLEEISQQTYQPMFFPPFAYYFLLRYILLGILLGIPTLLARRKEPGLWTFNLEKLLFLMLPSFIISIYPIVAFYFKLPVPFFFLRMGIPMEIIFGYSFITAIKKRKEV
ncbi:hypothetical protein [Priestia abyssalis]|uniref:hypothetical protein n=1 Tax=Priestia abyssalis TaxID=1221450 RepID=UPI000995CABE|nr:hypothetical protein [Priestia abyssalis]